MSDSRSSSHPAAFLPPAGKLSGALQVARRELADQVRDWRIITPILLLTLFFPLLMNFTAERAVDFVNRYGAGLVGDRLIPFLLMIVGFFPISISLVVALESFAGERERLTLEPLLATPLDDAQLYLGKMIASLAMPLSAAYLGIGVYLFGLWVNLGWVPEFELLAQILLLTTAQAVLMVSAAVVISSQATSVRSANLLASFVIVPVSQLIIGESLIMFWARYHILWWVVLALVLIAVVLGRMGMKLFNREELLGREIDVLNLRWIGRIFWRSFSGGAANPWAWLGGVFRVSLPKIWPAVGLMALALVGAFWIGLQQAEVFTLPAELLSMERLNDSLLQGFLDAGMLSSEGFAWILLHNMRAIAIATLLGIFSFGVLAVLLLMAPLGIIGYLAGNLALSGQNAAFYLGALVLPHAIFEVPAIILAGALTLRLGMVMLSHPGDRSLGENWVAALGEWARLSLALVLPLLILAALVEAFLTPLLALLMLST